MSRLTDLSHFYDLLSQLADRIDGLATLPEIRNWNLLPRRGVYFFFEADELRTESGNGLRVTRVGTHALKAGSSSSLAQRLRNHRGQSSGGGNHRGSIFRLLVGQALMARGDLAACQSWGVSGDPGKAAALLSIDRAAVKGSETPVETAVSNFIAKMPLLWLDIPDDPGPNSLRGAIERNSIALLSNTGREPLDDASSNWLGRRSNRPLVGASGLWNQNHVNETHDPNFLGTLERLIKRMEYVK